MNENIQHSILYGNGEMNWQRHNLYTPYIKSALCDVCQCNMRGERHKSELKSGEYKMVFNWKMQRKAVEMSQIISAVVPAWVYKELPSHMWWKTSSPAILSWLSFSPILQTIFSHLNLNGGIWQPHRSTCIRPA